MKEYISLFWRRILKNLSKSLGDLFISPFIRNGSENNPEAAADHLRLKYNRGKRYFNTAEQFIDRLASESSWTGKKYTINCSGETQESGVWLHKALIEYRDQQRSEQPPQ